MSFSNGISGILYTYLKSKIQEISIDALNIITSIKNDIRKKILSDTENISFGDGLTGEAFVLLEYFTAWMTP